MAKEKYFVTSESDLQFESILEMERKTQCLQIQLQNKIKFNRFEINLDIFVNFVYAGSEH